MVDEKPSVLIVDDDPEFRDSVGRLLRTVGLHTREFSSVSDFLAAEPADGPTCLGIAILSGLAAAIAMGLCAFFWIATAWPEGASAVSFAAVACALFASLDDPTPIQRNFITMLALCIHPYRLSIPPSTRDYRFRSVVRGACFHADPCRTSTSYSGVRADRVGSPPWLSLSRWACKQATRPISRTSSIPTPSFFWVFVESSGRFCFG